MENIEIKTANPGDEAVLAHIQTESWKSAFEGILSRDDLEALTEINRVTEMYKRTLCSYSEHGLILSVDGKPHCIAYWGASRESNMPDYAELICIHSLPENRRCGYGTVMMEHIFREIKNAGFEKIMLWVFENNIPARKFYEKLEFKPSGKTKIFRGAVEMMYCRSFV